MRHLLLYREIDFSKEELSAARLYFTCTSRRPVIKEKDFVIGRFSMLPYYREQVKDIEYVGATTINSYEHHLYVAELMNWVSDLKELTPKTWDRLEDLPNDCQFVLKGAINSKKDRWNELMFAACKATAIAVHSRLQDDGLIGHQHIYIRQYVPLVSYGTSINGCPISKEFRFFVAFGKVLCGAFYWSNHSPDIKVPSIDEVPKDFLDEVIRRIGDKVNFYAVDVAQAKDGHWLVIELNDGTCSGLSDNDPYKLYGGLKKVLNDKGIFEE